MKRALSFVLILMLCLASVPFAAADQSFDGTVVYLDDGTLSLELENGNIILLDCYIDTDAAAGDTVTVTYSGRLGTSARVTGIEILSSRSADGFTGTVTECAKDRFTVKAKNGSRISFLINEDTYLTGSISGLKKGMEVSVTYTGELSGDVYAVHIAVLNEDSVPDEPETPRVPERKDPERRETDPAYTSSVLKKNGRAVSVSSLCVGDTVTFGSYEQDGNTRNGKETIEWTVLDINRGSVLLLSKYALDMHVYNDETVSTTWASSSIRSFLNGSFLRSAFSGDEQNAIATTYVDNSASQGDSESIGGPATRDKVFLLSYKEAWRYLPNARDRQCIPTRYALSRCCMSSAKYKKNGTATTYWWLRSMGRTDLIALQVMSDGSKGFDNVSWGRHASDNMYNSGGCIRPAVWVNAG